MLLIIFLGLIAKLALVCDGCDVGSPVVDSLDWNQVDICVLTRFLKEAAFITIARIYISFVVPLTHCQ